MEEFYRDAYVTSCPYCGGYEMIKCMQSGYAVIYAKYNQFGGRNLYHSVCRRCGSVVRSFVEEPEKMLKKRDRRD